MYQVGMTVYKKTCDWCYTVYQHPHTHTYTRTRTHAQMHTNTHSSVFNCGCKKKKALSQPEADRPGIYMHIKYFLTVQLPFNPNQYKNP